jgi:hypothetical protein
MQLFLKIKINKMENLKYYLELKSVPQEALKEIQAGRLKGMSDINPMWRIKKLTEVFGMCGIGWKYIITEKRLEKGCNDQISAFVCIDLFVKVNGEWSDAIQGLGGASFVANEKNGLYQSDECFKMALTDAIGISCKALGMAADVYFAKDRTKYDKAIATPEQSEELSAILKAVKECKNIDDIKLLWDSLDSNEQAQTKAIFTKRKQELS